MADMWLKTKMTHSSRITQAGPLGVQPNQFGHEVWGDNVRPLRHLKYATRLSSDPNAVW